jgi:hypothetical protein
MADEERTGSCIICASRDPLPDLAPCCGPCRSRLSGQLRDIPILVEELTEEHEADPANDPVSALLPAAMVPGRSGAPRVRGSRERPVPISVTRVDLLAPADQRTVHDEHTVPMVRATGETEWVTALFGGKEVHQEIRRREVARGEAHPSQCSCGRPDLHPARGEPVMVPAGDQSGEISAATILDGWCRMFAEERRESVPTPRPADQSRWLLDRLDELFRHPAVDEVAKEIGDLWHVLRRACGRAEPKPELCQGVPCKWEGCDLRTLWRIPVSIFGEAEYVKCASCGRLMTISDFDDWARLNSAALCGRRNGDWYCALQKKHGGDCEPYRGEEATA